MGNGGVPATVGAFSSARRYSKPAYSAFGIWGQPRSRGSWSLRGRGGRGVAALIGVFGGFVERLPQLSSALAHISLIERKCRCVDTYVPGY